MIENLFRWLKIREELKSVQRITLGIVPIIMIFVIWVLLTMGEVEYRVLSPLILPAPLDVLKSLHDLWFKAGLSRSIIASTSRVIGGFIVSLLIAFPLGILMGAFSKVKALFDPLVIFGAYLPIPALVPLTLSLFGTEEFQKIMFLSLAFLVYLIPLFVKAVEEVDDVYLQTAYTLGATKWQTVRHVLFGIAAPRIFQSMRLGFGIGWTYIILAEMVAANRGLGQIIIVAQRRGPREYIYLVLVVIVIMAFITDKLWVLLGRKLFPYLEER
jgi:NitT/TauT family transport system permease protein